MPSLMSGAAGSSQRQSSGLAAGSVRLVADVRPMVLRRVQSIIGPTIGKFRRVITGISKDSVGAALAACTCRAFRTSDDVKVDTVISDANGVYVASVYDDATYWIKSDHASGVAGVTADTLVGT